jgi:radical SAM superfamily enzyme YgiQ (UPF0313 family)
LRSPNPICPPSLQFLVSSLLTLVLTTLNAKYAHAAFGLRYLFANLGPLQSQAKILEFEASQKPTDIVESILAENPRIVGLGIYIWNVAPATQVVAELKRLRPDVAVILGGPEVSHETDQQEICRLADYTITGEADLAFAELCEKILSSHPSQVEPFFDGKARPPSPQPSPGVPGEGEDTNARLPGQGPLTRIIPATLPDFSQLQLPYDFYTDEDLAHRVVYVEASRGCPFSCEFCLSSLDVPVRNVPLGRLLPALQRLLDRGLRRFKFVDRTFNLNLNFSRAILEFFWERYESGLFLHFEMIPDRLPEGLRDLIRKFPAGALQFEVGIQSFNPEVCQRISRRQDAQRAEENLRFLREQTGVHVHADLIVGLPGEDIESFAQGFDRLVGLGPQEIQVGLLKRLRGTPIVRHDRAYQMIYSPHPPYEILQTGTIDFATRQRLRRFARYWDLVANSGNFLQAAPLIWQTGSPFERFLHFSDWLFARTGKNHAIALHRLAELLFDYLTAELRREAAQVAQILWSDYQRGGRSDRPAFLAQHLPPRAVKIPRRPIDPAMKRQIRRLA